MPTGELTGELDEYIRAMTPGREDCSRYTVRELVEKQTFPRVVAYLPPWEQIPEALTQRYHIVNCTGPRGEFVHLEARTRT